MLKGSYKKSPIAAPANKNAKNFMKISYVEMFLVNFMLSLACF